MDQKSSRVYLTMVNDMKIILDEAKTLVGSGGLNTEEKLDRYYNCCERLKGVLKDSLYILLHRCNWFDASFTAI